MRMTHIGAALLALTLAVGCQSKLDGVAVNQNLSNVEGIIDDQQMLLDKLPDLADSIRTTIEARNAAAVDLAKSLAKSAGE